MTGSLKRIAFIPDCHVPFEDKEAFDLVVRVLEKWKPHILVVLGDFWDFYSVSSHQKSKRMQLVDELEAGKERLWELSNLAPKKYFVEGNHEFRLARYISDRAPELHGWGERPADICRAYGWEYTPYRAHTKIGKLYITHDVGHAGKHALTQSQAAFEGNLVIGHTHRIASLVTGSVRGDTHVAHMFGWLGDFRTVDYMHKAKMREWSHGFGIGYIEKDGVVHLQAVPIVNGTCVVEGKLYK